MVDGSSVVVVVDAVVVEVLVEVLVVEVVVVLSPSRKESALIT